MKKWFYKYLMMFVMLAITVLICALMWNHGFWPVFITAIGGLLLTAFAVFFFGVFTGLIYADHKLIRFTKKLKKLMNEASTIYVMGHAYSDLDSVGASYGLYYALRDTYNVKMVANKQTTLARTLVDFLRFSDKECKIYDYNEIKHTIDENALLIVVDTHRPVIMDFKEMYDRIDNVVIIDHHRKSEDFVDETVIKYMKSTASSACEIVTLIIRLLGVDRPATVAATALLSGIMLDTKNFVMSTGPTTFKCAAFLRQNRADPVLIKKMFSESVEVCKRKYDIVSHVELYENVAIAKTENQDQYTRIATAQAADELLTINGVVASFVMCPSGEEINISARSFGDVDVQKIMARLGGGGHKTAAACQIKTKDFKLVEKRLRAAISEFM